MAWLRRHWPMLALFVITAFLIGFTLLLGVDLEANPAAQTREASQ